MKSRIIELKEKGYSSKQIAEEIGCAKSTVSYHLKNAGFDSNKTKEETVANIIEYYKTHTAEETGKMFGVSKTTVKKYGESKRVLLTKEERKKKKSKAVVRRRQKIKEMAIEYKGGCCSKCGYDRYVGALEFHHLDPNEKDFSVARKGHCTSWEKVKKELDKCILVCANCHREIHEEIRINGL